MVLKFEGSALRVIRESSDPKYYGVLNGSGESKLLHDIKKQLNKDGYDLIKKRMWKDGHLVDDMQQYLRTRKKGSGEADIYIFNGEWVIRGANEYFNTGEVVLNVGYDIFK